MQFRQYRDRLFLPQLESLGHGNVFSLSFHRKQGVDQRDRLARDLWCRFLRFHELPSRVAPTSCTSDGVAGYHPVVTTISIGQQNLRVVFQKFLRARSTAVQGEVEYVVGV